MNLVAWLRLGMVVVVAWPFLIAAAAMVGVPTLTALVALLPLVAGVSYVVVGLDPVLAAQLMADARVLRSWQTIRTVILVELAIGAYLTFVPVQAKPFLLVQLALVLTILALSRAGGFLVKLVPKIAGAIFVWLTVSFFWNNLSTVLAAIRKRGNLTEPVHACRRSPREAAFLLAKDWSLAAR